MPEPIQPNPLMLDVSREHYEQFRTWLYNVHPGRFDRDVKHFVDPPLEVQHDSTCLERYPVYGEDSIVAVASLIDAARGDIDPRPAGERGTGWWRANCKIREDWLLEWIAKRDNAPTRDDVDTIARHAAASAERIARKVHAMPEQAGKSACAVSIIGGMSLAELGAQRIAEPWCVVVARGAAVDALLGYVKGRTSEHTIEVVPSELAPDRKAQGSN